jgi:hypothetical protein
MAGFANTLGAAWIADSRHCPIAFPALAINVSYPDVRHARGDYDL